MNKHDLNLRNDISGVLRESYAGKRVLVTGHTGFKGAWLSLWLMELGAEVTGLSLPATSPRGIFSASGLEHRMRSIIGDVRKLDDIKSACSIARPELVFHLAAQPLVGTSYQDPLSTFDVNVMGTARLLDAVRTSKEVRAVVIVTSDKCYENSESLWGYREVDPLGGRDPYSASKACAELVSASYRASFFDGESAPRLATARAGNVIGGGDWGEFRLIPDCIDALREGNALVLRNPQHTRPFQFVLDALAGYLLLGARLAGDAGQQYASGWNFGPQGGARAVAEAARNVVQEWGAGKIQHNGQELFTEKSRLSLDSTKALTLLGWKSALNFEASIRSTTAWYKHQYEIGDGDMFDFSRKTIAAFEKELSY